MTTNVIDAELAKKIVHHLNAIAEEKAVMTPSNALKMIKAVPGLYALGNKLLVHRICGVAGPVVADMYKKDPHSEQGALCYHLMHEAGKICFGHRLAGIDRKSRLNEFETFEPFMAQNRAYQVARERFMHKYSDPNQRRIPMKLYGEPVEVYHLRRTLRRGGLDNE